MVHKTAEQWARINERRERGLGVRSAPSARVAQATTAKARKRRKGGSR